MLDLTRVPFPAVPGHLGALHRDLRVGDRRRLRLPPSLDALHRSDVTTGAGLRVVRGLEGAVTTVERIWSLPDTVGPGMKLLVCGLNPSPAAADSGIGFHRAGNRFWPAALAAGLVTVDRDADHALAEHGIGMTDIVKRTTRRADELSRDEYVAGLARIDRLVTRLCPAAVCFVGLAGWRSAVARTASAGWQPDDLGGRPVYLMPSTSGLNASTSLAELTAHLVAAAAGP